jgi:hypothetical protein
MSVDLGTIEALTDGWSSKGCGDGTGSITEPLREGYLLPRPERDGGSTGRPRRMRCELLRESLENLLAFARGEPRNVTD